MSMSKRKEERCQTKDDEFIIYPSFYIMYAAFCIIPPNISNMEKQSASDFEELQAITLGYLFRTFLKIGATSFGGFIALVSVIQDQMVARDKIIKEEVILDGISLASVLPGPLAVNVSTYVGYSLMGLRGGLVAMFAVLLPSFVLVWGLSAFYFSYGSLPAISHIFAGILPAVSAVIIAVALRMSKKAISDWKQGMIALGAGLALLLIGGFFTTLGVMLAGGILGILLYTPNSGEVSPAPDSAAQLSSDMVFSLRPLLGTLALLVVGILLLVVIPFQYPELPFIGKLRDLVLTFSGMSLTLFGGGYVMIPAMHEVIVDQLHWLTTQEFADGIAMGQFTPGPILISAAFIGYKLAGFSGAALATLAIFLPPALAMITASHFLRNLKDKPVIIAIFKGLRPAVIGMIFTAAYTLISDVPFNWVAAFIFSTVLLLAIRFKVNAVYLIPLSGALGWLLY